MAFAQHTWDVAEGRILCGGAFLEGPNDYGLKAQRTIAVKQDEQWVINGQKISVVNGKTAEFFIVFCNTDSGTGEHIASSLFLIDKVLHGVMVGGSGQAQHIMKSYWNECRILLAGMAVGLAQGAFDRARAYVKQRSQFGKNSPRFRSRAISWPKWLLRSKQRAA